jgi:hypothetical protein
MDVICEVGMERPQASPGFAPGFAAIRQCFSRDFAGRKSSDVARISMGLQARKLP